MAKMFYTLEEAAQKLGMSEDEVRTLGESGQLQEFRDQDRLMFKREQVDLLAGDGGGGDDEITLAESSELEPISMSNSGSGSALSLEDSASGSGGTGVSIFDPDDATDADSNADTLVTGGLNPADLPFDSAGSGSGLSNLALEPDDTSLGGNLLEGLDSGDSQLSGMGSGMGSAAGESAMGSAPAISGALFEGGGEETDFGTATPQAALMPMQEAYDGPWSGLAAGAALGMIVLLGAAIGVVVLGLTGSGTAGILDGIDQNTLYMVAGGGAGVIVLLAIIGWAILRRS